MANRKRGTNSIIPPEFQTSEKILTKQQSAARTNPACPHVPYKLRKTVLTTSENMNDQARPISFGTKTEVELSPLYKPEQKESYVDQIFPVKFGIGEGSFGKVYYGKSIIDGQSYAIKILKPVRLEKYRYDEIRNNERVGEHPNIVQFIMAWEEAYEIYMQLEYCKLSLADYVMMGGIPTDTFLWQLLSDMSNALNFLHSKNFIHLDVKPGNIMMKRGIFKLCDFGTLIELTSIPKVDKNLSDGDAKYLAKEVLDGIYTPACDIYGLGITLLELAGNFDLPGDGPLWLQLRNNILPKAFYQSKDYPYVFKLMLEGMMKGDYKLRPTAKQLLKIPNIRDVSKKDAKEPRPDYDGDLLLEKGFDEVPYLPVNNNNNNIDSTPPSVVPDHLRHIDNPGCEIHRINIQGKAKGMLRRALFTKPRPRSSKPATNSRQDDSFEKAFAKLLDDDNSGIEDRENANPDARSPQSRPKPLRRSLRNLF